MKPFAPLVVAAGRNPCAAIRSAAKSSARPTGSGRVARVAALAGLILGLVAGRGAPAFGQCGSDDEILASLHGLDLDAASRTALFDREPPWDLYEKAASKRGRVVIRRKGAEGFAVAIYDLEAVDLWRSLNDFELQVSGGYLPLRFAKVLSRSPDGDQLDVVQLFKQAGMGRWWVNRIYLNEELHRASGGRLWEMHWEDLIDETDLDDLPQPVQDAEVRSLVESRGAWLAIEVSPGCSVLEYYTYSDPGGFLGAIQWLVARRAIRGAVQGMADLAADYGPDALPAPFEEVQAAY